MRDNLARVLPQEHTVNIRRTIKPKVKPRARAKAKSKFRWGLAAYAMVFAALAMVIVLRYGVIAQYEKQINTVKAQYEQLESRNIARQVELKQNVNLEEIEKIATEKLGMVNPGKNQVVRIRVPVNDSAEVLAPGNNSEGVFAKAFRYIGDAMSYLN